MSDYCYTMRPKNFSKLEKNILYYLLEQKAVSVESAVWASNFLSSRAQCNKFYKRLCITPYINTHTEIWEKKHKKDVQVYLTSAGVVLTMSIFNLDASNLLEEIKRSVIKDEYCTQDIQPAQLRSCTPQ